MWRYLGWQTSLFVLWSTLGIILPHTLLLCYQPVLKKAPWQESHGAAGGSPYLWDRVALVLAGVTVLLSSGCGNKMPETAWRTQQTFITHSPGGWRSKGPADSVSVESLFPCVWVRVSMSPLSSDAANMINKNPIGFLEILSLLVVPWVQGTESSPSWPGSILFLYILFHMSSS